jgi:hypothetical protein
MASQCPSPLFSYLTPGQAFAGEPVDSFTIGFDAPYGPTYTYEPGSGLWSRSIGSQPFLDASGQQVAPANVIVQFVPCCLDVPEGGIYLTVGSGEAWVFANGKMVRGTWSRNDRSQVTSFTDENHQPIALTPGRTWVEFVPDGVDVSVTAPSPPASRRPPHPDRDVGSRRTTHPSDLCPRALPVCRPCAHGCWRWPQRLS